MDKEFWNQRWNEGRIGFHTPEPHWALDAQWSGIGLASDTPVLVPLCGKTLDMHWLRARGHPVTGIELNAVAVRDFFREWRRTPRIEHDHRSGIRWHRFDAISLGQGDFFSYRATEPFSAFYDRAALIALPAEMRESYMAHLRCCLADGALGLLVTLEYQQNQKSGPPFSVHPEEISSFPRFEARLLDRRDVLADSPRFREAGLNSLHETTYRLMAV